MKIRRPLSCFFISVLLFLANLDYAQSVTPSTSSEVQTQKIPISGNVALYAFLRVAAADDASPKANQAISRALLSEIGLADTDRLALQKIFSQYATGLRALHANPASTLSPLDTQRSEITLYANVIHRIRAELSANGIQKLHSYLENKKAKMMIRTHEEIAK